MPIRFFDMFAGIGGFRSGLEAIGGFECIGHCEIDKQTNTAYCAIYDTEGEYYCDDAREIDPDEMPDFDLICAGFPCQSFSVAGKRLGFADTRGTQFFKDPEKSQDFSGKGGAAEWTSFSPQGGNEGYGACNDAVRA